MKVKKWVTYSAHLKSIQFNRYEGDMGYSLNGIYFKSDILRVIFVHFCR